MERKEARFFIVVGVLFVAVAAWLLLGGWDWIYENLTIETVYVESTYEEYVLDRPSTSLRLTVTGNGNDVTITPETNIKKLEVEGNENSINLCDGVHDPEIENFGFENEVIFSSC